MLCNKTNIYLRLAIKLKLKLHSETVPSSMSYLNYKMYDCVLKISIIIDYLRSYHFIHLSTALLPQLLNHRMSWLGMDLNDHLVPTPWHIVHHIQLPGASSNLTSNTYRDGAPTTSYFHSVYFSFLPLSLTSMALLSHAGFLPCLPDSLICGMENFCALKNAFLRAASSFLFLCP